MDLVLNFGSPLYLGDDKSDFIIENFPAEKA